MRDDNFDIAELERAMVAHFMAGFDGPDYPLRDCWPGVPGKAYCLEMIRRTYGMAGVEHAKRLKIFTSH
jgi:hypothetical protein